MIRPAPAKTLPRQDKGGPHCAEDSWWLFLMLAMAAVLASLQLLGSKPGSGQVDPCFGHGNLIRAAVASASNNTGPGYCGPAICGETAPWSTPIRNGAIFIYASVGGQGVGSTFDSSGGGPCNLNGRWTLIGCQFGIWGPGDTQNFAIWYLATIPRSLTTNVVSGQTQVFLISGAYWKVMGYWGAVVCPQMTSNVFYQHLGGPTTNEIDRGGAFGIISDQSFDWGRMYKMWDGTMLVRDVDPNTLQLRDSNPPCRFPVTDGL